MEGRDGYSIISIGGRLGVAGARSTFVRMQTLFRPTTGDNLRVENIGAGDVDTGVRFGYVRTTTTVTALVFVPANGGQLRIAEFGNVGATAPIAIGPTPPPGFVEVLPVSAWSSFSTMGNRIADVEQEVDALTQNVQALQTIIAGITVV